LYGPRRSKFKPQEPQTPTIACILEDAVMAQVDSILAHVNAAAELEVIDFAA
jgi:hypothetical protein